MRAFLLVCLVVLSALPLTAQAEQVQVRLTDLEREYTDWRVDQQYSCSFAQGYQSIKPVSIRYKGYCDFGFVDWTSTVTGDTFRMIYPMSIIISTDTRWQLSTDYWDQLTAGTDMPGGAFDITTPFRNAAAGVLTPVTVTGTAIVNTIVSPPYNYYEPSGGSMPFLRLDEVYMTFETTPVPEPSSLLTLLCGIGGLAGGLRHRRS